MTSLTRGSQELQQMALRPNDIADRNQRKIRAIGPSGFGIDGRGSGGTVTRAQNVAADDAVALVAEQPFVIEQLRPPGGHLGGAGKRVADEHDVIARGIRLAVHGITDGDGAQHAAALQGKALLFGEGVLSLDQMQSVRTHFALFPPATRSASC